MSWQRATKVAFPELSWKPGKSGRLGRLDWKLAAGIKYHQRVYQALQRVYGTGPLQLEIEPWLRHVEGRLRQPDAVLLDGNLGLVIEVKRTWLPNIDLKLREEYVPAVRHAFGLAEVRPLVITSNVRGLPQRALLGNLATLWDQVMAWPGSSTPVWMLRL